MTRICQTVALALAILFATITPAHAQGGVEQGLLAAFRESIIVLRIRYVDANNPDGDHCEAGTGTGFIISEHGYLLTSAHLFIEPEHCLELGLNQLLVEGRIARSDGGEWLKISPLRLPSDVYDVAIAKLPSGRLYEHVRTCAEVKPIPGESYYIAGFTSGIALVPYPYLYVSTDPALGYDMWLGTADSEAGVSGGPVIDNTLGRVVGIYQGVPSSNAGNLPFRAVIPIQVAEAAGAFEIAGIENDNCEKEETIDAGCDQWMSPSEFNACFQQQLTSNFYPMNISGATLENGDIAYRVRWEPVSRSPGFCFMSCIGLSDSRFETLDRSLAAEGLNRLFRSRVGPAQSLGSNAATWMATNYAFCDALGQTFACN